MKTEIAIIGGGSSSLLLADQLSDHFKVTIYEQGKTIGRKYLVAGKGGFNLSHNLESEELPPHYSPPEFLTPALQKFGVTEIRNWYTKIGIPTYIGSSNRVFPEKGISPADVLRTIKNRLKDQGVLIKTQHTFQGFDSNTIPQIISADGNRIPLKNQYCIFSLGGGSWKVTGSNSEWLKEFTEIGMDVLPFEASNCGLDVFWPETILKSHIGKPLKNISVKINATVIKGEALITEYGLEGNAIYPISMKVREELKIEQEPQIFIDFKPALTAAQILQKMEFTKTSNYTKALKIDASSWSIIKAFTSKEEYSSPEVLARIIKALPIPVRSLRPIEESISTVGGIKTDNLNPDYSWKNNGSIYCIGEMVNWDAPTGGFLLHGCFAMANHLAEELIKHKKAD